MTPDRWERICDLFDEALAYDDPEARAAFVRAASARDEALAAEVFALLEEAGEAGPADALLDAFSSDLLPSIAPADAPAVEGREIGPYRVLGELGRGGMGHVYLAERADGQFEQQVALKLVRGGLHGEALTQRFLHERRILARLQHPHIARLYDGGVTAEGQPYFAMEVIDGQPIDAYCDARRLSITQRLRLFVTVCKAVQYAHQNLVVHRDLKPSNILITDEGQVKLLDFGIARLLEDDGTEGLTRTGFQVMTPAYASPEQIRGEAATTASDVYTLGVVLYALLTGQRPYDVTASSPSEVERIVCHTTPPRPSTAVTRLGTTESDAATPEAVSRARATQPVRLQRRLAGDLDMIVLQALAKDPTRRYASAEQLAQDLTRHLAGLPVTARGDSLAYRARKFVQRHRAGVAVAAAFALVLLAATALALRQQAETARERDRAQLEAEKNAQVTAYLTGLFTASNPYEETSGDPTASDLLARGVDQIGTLDAQPEVQAAMRNLLGKIHQSRGAYDEAVDLLSQALAQRRQLFGPAHPDVAATQTQLGIALWRQGQPDSAAWYVEQALAFYRRHSPTPTAEVVYTVSSLGTLRRIQGRYADAERLLREARTMNEQLAEPDSFQQAAILNNLALTLGNQGAFDESEALYRASLALLQDLYGDEHPQVAMQLHNVAGLLQYVGKLDEAEAMQRRALAMETAFLGERHPNVLTTQNQLGILLTDRGAYDEAEAVLRRTLTLRREVLGPDHPDVGATLNNVARVLNKQDRPVEAEPFMRESLAMSRAQFGDDHLYTGIGWRNLGDILAAQGRVEEAEAALRRALAILAATLPDGHPDTALMQHRLGDFLIDQEEYAEAESLLEAGYEALLQAHGADHEQTRLAKQSLARLYEAMGDSDEAARWASS